MKESQKSIKKILFSKFLFLKFLVISYFFLLVFYRNLLNYSFKAFIIYSYQTYSKIIKPVFSIY
jgi:hypothetical protein